jgi:hypothetical protein
MRALCDYPITLPYSAVVRWPLVERNGQPDWIDSVYTIEDWLEHSVGPHYVKWVWSMWSLHQSHLCSVSFARPQDSTLFLLRWA